MIKVGIVGGAGYTAGELLRILLYHPKVELSFVYSTTQAGEPIYKTHTDLFGETEMCFSGEILTVDVIFLCLGHGVSRNFLETNSLPSSVKIIDLGNDFRLERFWMKDNLCRDFIYGLPEIYRDSIRSAQNIANPGCFATAIQLALIPLASKGLLSEEVHVNAVTGSTGAGRSLSETTHFSYRNNNISVYKAFNHQHLGEISLTLTELNKNKPEINFIPVRGNFARGILATSYMNLDLEQAELEKIYFEFYKGRPFTFVSKQEISMKDVVNTNKCLLHVKKYGKKVLITSAIDNLLKGASGQAVQNMNLMFGLPENTGLNLKSIGF